MESQWASDLDAIDSATARLLETVASFDDADIAEPSLLPNWTRGHVLAHIEGNARGMGRLARQQIDGFERPMYISREVRNADMEIHASRPAVEHLSAISQSAQEQQRDFRTMPPGAAGNAVTLGASTQVRVSRLPPQRLFEVCVHHADLGVSTYTWREWPSRVADYFIPVVTADFRGDGAFPVGWVEADGTRYEIVKGSGSGVRGAANELLAWLIGRSDGSGLEAVGIEPVPTAPAWR